MKIEFIHTQRVLCPTQIKLAPYVINPYRGCEFGCVYCYSQENKNIKKRPFSNYLGVKINAPEELEKELSRIKPSRVLLGSVTECFQYQELNYRITQKILCLLNRNSIPYTILTKSPLIEEYLPLIAKNKKNKIYYTFNFHSERLRKSFEKNSPSLKKRLQAIKKINSYNIALRIHIGPFIPYFSELEKIISLIGGLAKEINVELYHYKMGNFPMLLKIAEQLAGEKIKENLASVYTNKKNYSNFVQNLEKQIIKIKETNNAMFFYIVPDFDNYYQSSIEYYDTIN